MGKIENFPRLWERVFTVLVNHFAPRQVLKIAQGPPIGLKRGFVVHRHHAAWGADLAKCAGASARTVSLIEMHHSAQVDDVDLAALQAVDDG